MESRRPSEPTPSETREARGRSRSPDNSNPPPEAPLGGRKRRGSVDHRSPSEVKRFREEDRAKIQDLLAKYTAEAEASMAEYAAEKARRQALSVGQRLQEDGNELRQKIEADPEMVVMLEVSASHRARCRANDDCIHLRANALCGKTITSHLRICVHGVQTMAWYGRTQHYYHALCFAFMIDLTTLLPEKFKFDGTSGRPGLMVEKWFEHSGRIDLDKIAKFLEEFDEFEAKKNEYNKWRGPLRPDPPSKPELGDCTKEDGDPRMILLGVLKHRLAMKRIGERWEE